MVNLQYKAFTSHRGSANTSMAQTLHWMGIRCRAVGAYFCFYYFNFILNYRKKQENYKKFLNISLLYSVEIITLILDISINRNHALKYKTSGHSGQKFFFIKKIKFIFKSAKSWLQGRGKQKIKRNATLPSHLLASLNWLKDASHLPTIQQY